MAGVSVKTKIATKQSSYDIFFDGALLSSTRGSLVVELIKYFLYERQQIPMPVDELKEQVVHEENLNLGVNDHDVSIRSKLKLHHFNKSNAQPDAPLTDLTNFDSSYTNAVRCNPNNSHTSGVFSLATHLKTKASAPEARASKCSQDRRAKLLVRELMQLFESLQKAFESCPEIEQVAVILGGTVMNPKESYLINFPPPCPEADSIPLLSCKRTLFQHIIGEDVLGTMSATVSPTSMMILVLAPRSCPLKGFMPKHFMRSPKSGDIISFNFHCNYLLPVCYDLTFGDGDLEMSGIEFLDKLGKDRSVVSEKNALMEGDENRTKCAHGKDFEGNSQNCNCEFLAHSQLISMKICEGNEDLSVSGNGALRKVSHSGLISDLRPVCRVVVSPVVNGCTPATVATNQMNSDCIWYQSPFVIKGYRIKDLVHNRLTCS